MKPPRVTGAKVMNKGVARITKRPRGMTAALKKRRVVPIKSNSIYRKPPVVVGVDLATQAATGAAVFEGVFSVAENLTAYSKGDKSGVDAIADTGRAVAGAACTTALVTAAVGATAAAVPIVASGLLLASPAMFVFGAYSVVKRTAGLMSYACS